MARRMPAVGGVVLSHLEFDLLWSDLDLGAPPYPLEIRSHGFTMAERDQLGGRVFESLDEAGLIDGDEVAAWVEDLLVLLSRPVLSVDALIIGQVPLRLVAVAGHRQAVLAVLDHTELALRPIRPAELTEVVADVIGDVGAGPGQPVTLAREAFSAAMNAFASDGHEGFTAALAREGVTGRAVRALSSIVDSPRTCSGQFAANGPAGRSPIVAWFDTEAGRYGVTVEAAGAGRLVTVTPADKRWLAARLSALLDRVRGHDPAGEAPLSGILR
ncbi:ESX secretion-associated protein EspG [Amycolatopsis pigmentata]|uniref:ESX secretion-associated protein EspG n=1 Tax=Amycolatopsis pigmentata TaxID=450801 RepID=A0ABW5FM03_9PSEU